ncbi:MAG TPA: hypothetical protein VLM37_08020, partial [Fibrobacteraceae bacterium]|nr:hypothetical protein [Fibrobacteraceae bacterium]
TASITEDGEITSIWVNGSELSSLDGVATYNSTTGLWDLDIPVKLTIGANTIDITIFAGPDTDCEECQENGGCAFVNHNFYIQFSKGDATASTLSIIDASTGAAVTSPATPGSTEFSIQVRDLDKIKSGASTVTALVINSRLLDTLEVTLTLGADSVFRSSADISAVSKKGSALGNNEVSFFGGDTIVVRYIDPDDEDDVSEQSFYAESSYPTLAGAEAVDSDCDGVMDLVRVYLSSSLDEGISASRASLIVNDLNTDVSDTVSVSSTGFTISNDTLSIPVSSYDLTAEGAISGSVSVTFLNSDAESATQSSLLTDRVEPHLISVTILEKETTDESENDTIRLGFSESVTLSPTGWPLDLTTQAGGSVDVSGLSLISEAAKNSGKSWQIVLAANTVVDTGLLASIASAYTVTDVAGNILGSGCAKDTVEITESPRPVPIEFAIMRDTDNDGDPDLLYMQFKSSLTSKNILDSFVVQWGGEIKSFTQYTPVDGDSSQWTITVADLYELGATSGPYSGMGGVTPRLGASGAFFDSTYMIQDSVGPILLSASKASMSSGIDSLGIVVSEPVDTVSGVYMLERKRGDKVVVLVPEACSSIRSSDSLFVFYYNDDSQGAVRAGDSVRLVSANPGVKDMAGNAPPAYAPWIVVEGKLSPEVEYAVSMVSSVSGQNASQGYISDNPDEGDDFRVTLLSGGNELKIAEGSSTLTTNMAEQPYDSTYQHVGPTFQVDLQLPSGSLLQDNTYVWYYSVSVRLKIFDNLGQFVNAVNYKFSIDDIGRDYLSSGGSITMYFEWLSHDGVGPLAQSGRHVGSGAYIGAFDFSSVAIAQVSDADSDGDGELEYTKGDKIESDATKRRVFGVMRK